MRESTQEAHLRGRNDFSPTSINLADILESCEKSWCSSFKFPLLLGLASYPRERDHKSPHQDVSAMLTVAKRSIKQRTKIKKASFLLSVLPSNENAKMENPGA